jgi:hypothetical protein
MRHVAETLGIDLEVFFLVLGFWWLIVWPFVLF